MYKNVSKFYTQWKLRKQVVVENQKKGKGVSRDKEKAVTKPCSICKITPHGSMLSLHVDDYAVCNFCQDKHFKDREEPQVILKSAIDISIRQGIEMGA